jgi:hypothetical protein
MGVDEKMSSNVTANNLLSPFLFDGPPLSCRIRGRLISCRELLPRLKNYCLSLGFNKPIIMASVQSAGLKEMYADSSVSFLAEKDIACSGNDSVTILSTRVFYNRNWGVYSGLPCPLIHETTDCRADGTISNFIAPYLALYTFAQNHIYIACHEANQYFITLPPDFISGGRESEGIKLKILLEKIVDLDEKGRYFPHGVSDSFISFRLSANFSQLLRKNDFSWSTAKNQRIGTLLTSELLVFEGIQQANGNDGNSGRNGRKSTFAETLSPVMSRIVTDTHPQLLAAMIYLQSEFSQVVDEMHHAKGKNDSENLLCIAGLDIDLGAFRGRGERYFVPLTAYLRRGGVDDALNEQLKQDDLFVALMAQETNV